MNELDTQNIIDCVKKVMNELNQEIMVEASGRHVHLSRADTVALFGREELIKKRDLSQPGQFVSDHKITLVGPKGVIRDVTVLGPCRNRTQIEISITDARQLGTPVVVRESGDLDKAPNMILCAKENTVLSQNSVIIAKRHIHMKNCDADALQVKDKDIVKVRVSGDRALIFDDVVVRVNDNYKLSMHIDYDEANAVGLNKFSAAKIL